MAKTPRDANLGAAGTHLMEFGQKMQQREGQEPRPPAKVIQLPLWPAAKRGVPNALLRGALFAAIQGKDRVAQERELVAVQDGVEIRYTGVQLTQTDLDVWEQVLHLARLDSLGSRVSFTARGFLKALGRRGTGQNIEWLKVVLARLTGAVVEITHEHRRYFGTLIEEGAEDEDTGRYVVEINPKMMVLYGSTRWTAIDWEQRRRLRSKPLALWLHGFYASHAAPHALTVEYLHKLSGSRTKELRYFKKNLAQALRDLESAGAIRGFEIRDNLVRVQTVPSKSQQRHLAVYRPPVRRRK